NADLKTVDPEVVVLYERLSREAGPIAEAALQRHHPPRRRSSTSKTGAVERVASVGDYTAEIDRLGRDVRSTHERIAELDSMLAQQTGWAKRNAANVAERDQLIQQLQDELHRASASSGLEIDRLQKLVAE